MSARYDDVYPEAPLVDSAAVLRSSAAALMTVQWFRAEPGGMRGDVFAEHHVLLNLKAEPHRAENRGDGEQRDFTHRRGEVVVTPAGMRSGWRWHATSDVIVVAPEPGPAERFAETELGLVLTDAQLRDTPLFSDPDLVAAGTMLRDTLEGGAGTADVMFEAMARVFLVELLQRYGARRPEQVVLSARFTSVHHRAVLGHVRDNLERTVCVDDLASVVAMSEAHFARVFRRTVGRTPMQFVTAHRIDQAALVAPAAANGHGAARAWPAAPPSAPGTAPPRAGRPPPRRRRARPLRAQSPAPAWPPHRPASGPRRGPHWRAR